MGGPSQSEKNQQQQSWTNLNSLFSTAADAAKSFGTSGKGTLDQVTSYFKNLLGGNRAATMQAVAPAANAARAGADAQKKEQATMGTGRTGGTAAQNQTIDDQVRAAIDNLIAGAAPAAAGALTGIGQADIAAMMNALGLGTEATGTAGAQISSDINSRRAASAAMWSSLIGGVGDVAGAFIGKPKVPRMGGV